MNILQMQLQYSKQYYNEKKLKFKAIRCTDFSVRNILCNKNINQYKSPESRYVLL